MKDAERLADQYLRSLALGEVVYEPDGNVPPDFSIDGRIAVEVRRLNQIYIYENKMKEGLEELSIPIWNRFKKNLSSLGPSFHGECWYVCIYFRRPLEKPQEYWPLIESRLQEFRSRHFREQSKLEITQNLSLELFRSGKDHGYFFMLSTSRDEDSGGRVINEIERNLRLCISEKEAKIAPYRSRYREWWLVLADHIDYSMDDEDRQKFRSYVMPRLSHSFTKIIILDPRGQRSVFEA